MIRGILSVAAAILFLPFYGLYSGIYWVADFVRPWGLHAACRRGYLRRVEGIVAKGGNANKKNWLGVTPLEYAVKAKRVNVVSVLIRGGGNIEAKQGRDRSVLRQAVGDPRIIEAFLNAGISPDTDVGYGENLLLVACRKNAGTARLLLERGANAFAKDEQGRNAVFAAVEGLVGGSGEEWRELLLTLFDRGVEQVEDEKGRTPLHVAVSDAWGPWRLEGMRLLLQKAASVNAKDKEGRTALMLAIQRFSRETESLLDMLLDAGADMRSVDGKGRTVVHHLALSKMEKEQFLAVGELLCRHGADLNVQDGLGMTPLHVAVKDGSATAVSCLVRMGVDDEVRTGKGETALSLAKWRLEDAQDKESRHEASEVMRFLSEFAGSGKPSKPKVEPTEQGEAQTSREPASGKASNGAAG